MLNSRRGEMFLEGMLMVLATSGLIVIMVFLIMMVLVVLLMILVIHVGGLTI